MASQEPKSLIEERHVEPPEAERVAHVQRLMNRLIGISPMYFILLSSIRLVSTSYGRVTTRLTLQDNHIDSRGWLTGAVCATIIDFTTGLAIASWDLKETTGESIDMHISYISSAKVGDTVEIASKADKLGEDMSFTAIRISKIEEDGSLTSVTVGKHTRYVRQSNSNALAQPSEEQ